MIPPLAAFIKKAIVNEKQPFQNACYAPREYASRF